MSSDMAQGEGLEPMNGLCGEAAGESWLSLLSHPAANLIQTNHSPFVTGLRVCSLYWEPALWEIIGQDVPTA